MNYRLTELIVQRARCCLTQFQITISADQSFKHLSKYFIALMQSDLLNFSRLLDIV
jgi:hypothetical protein